MSLSISNSKRNWKKYLLHLFLFFVFLVAFDRSGLFLIKEVEAHFYQSGFEERFANYLKENNFNTIILGTSRAYEGIHPFYIEKALNQKVLKEAYQGKGPKYNYYFYKLYKKYAGKPKVVIYGVDYFIYTVTSDPRWMARFGMSDENMAKIDYCDPTLLLWKYKKSIDNFHNNVMLKWKNTLEEKETHVDEADAIYKEYNRLHEYIGGEPSGHKLVSIRPRKFMRQLYPKFPGKEGHYFIKLLEELDRDNVTVVLVTIPSHYGTFKTNFKRVLLLTHLKRLADKYKNVVFYNYNKRGTFPLKNDAYFLDGGYGKTNSHLSRAGAEAFNKILIKDLKKYYGSTPKG